VAGRIRDEDIAELRERAPIDEVVSAYVTLRNAGSGSQKGLCPFHDEKTPSFTVTPARQYFHCFGCGQGGDVLSFVQQVEGLSFVEAVEKLATRFGVELRYVEGGPRTGADHGQRQRLVEANRLAQQFYAAQLAETEEAVTGRRFLSERGFDQEVSDRFGVGYAPRSGEALLRHLRGRDVRDEDMVAAGVVARGGRGLYDRFRGRLLWPIRELSGEVVGFGARRLHDDDRIEAKYLNTPDTALYKKSHLLYGVDLARREIARSQQAVVVEGYTDVMACHLSGVPTAVATCGTPATCACPTVRRPCASWWPAGFRSTGSCSATWSTGSTSTAPTGASTRYGKQPDWWPACVTAARSMPSPASSPGWSASSRTRCALSFGSRRAAARAARPRRVSARRSTEAGSRRPLTTCRRWGTHASPTSERRSRPWCSIPGWFPTRPASTPTTSIIRY
jgi:DNA primase catalytic core